MEFEEDIILTPQRAHLNRLSTILNYELAGSILFFGSIFISYFLGLLIVAAYIIVPYVAYVLYIERKWFWFIILLMIFLIPNLVSLIFFEANLYAMVVSVALFLFYCLLLKVQVREWIVERNWKIKREYEKKLKAQEY